MRRGSSLDSDSSAAPGTAGLRDLAPTEPVFTPYDEEHMAIYLSLLFAEAEELTPADIGRTILGIEAEQEPARFETVWRSHLARAHWLAENGWALLQDVP